MSAIEEKSLIKEKNFYLLPVVSHSTSAGFSYGGIALFRNQNTKRKENFYLHRCALRVLFSTKKFYSLKFVPSYILKKDKFQISTYFKYQNWTTSFYGIGNNSHNKLNEESFIRKDLESKFIFQQNFTKKIMAKYNFEYAFYNQSDLEQSGYLYTNNVIGYTGGNLLGMGIQIIADYKNDKIFPSSGFYLTSILNKYSKFLKSDFVYYSFEARAKKFLPLSDSNNFVLGLMTEFCHSKGDVPFQKLFYLGDKIRGFNDRYYPDKNFLSLRSEIRLKPFEDRFIGKTGYVLFLETGQVAENISHFRKDNFRLVYGVGTRIKIFPENDFILRVDIGFFKGNYNYHFSFGEAF